MRYLKSSVILAFLIYSIKYFSTKLLINCQDIYFFIYLYSKYIIWYKTIAKNMD